MSSILAHKHKRHITIDFALWTFLVCVRGYTTQNPCCEISMYVYRNVYWEVANTEMGIIILWWVKLTCLGCKILNIIVRAHFITWVMQISNHWFGPWIHPRRITNTILLFYNLRVTGLLPSECVLPFVLSAICGPCFIK